MKCPGSLSPLHTSLYPILSRMLIILRIVAGTKLNINTLGFELAALAFSWGSADMKLISLSLVRALWGTRATTSSAVIYPGTVHAPGLASDEGAMTPCRNDRRALLVM